MCKGESQMKTGNLCDVAGLLVGHAQDEAARTGCTVLFAPGGFVAGVDVRGAAPGTRETDLLQSEAMMPRVNAIVLSGGSAYGLDACSGVMRALEARGEGFQTPEARVPIVCGAVLYDLAVGSAQVRPDAAMGERALLAATADPVFGRVGAGTGATVGKLVPGAQARRSGIGSASVSLPGGGTVAAMVVVNACGDIYDPETGACVACGTVEGRPVRARDALQLRQGLAGQNTTIGVVATDVRLTKTECNRLATVAHDGYALAIRPTHTVSDGDTLFAVSLGEKACGAAGRRGGGGLARDPGRGAARIGGRSMLKGLGCDLVEVRRVARGMENPRFLERVFTEGEREAIAHKGASTAAGLWAAKEAVSKALGTGFVGFALRDIEILTDEDGAPHAYLRGGAQARLAALGALSIWVSISHDGGFAMAVAAAE